MVRSVRPRCGAKVAAYSIGVCQSIVGQRGAGMGHWREQGFVQQFVTQPSIEAFDEGVLRRLSRRDVMPVDFAFVGEVLRDNHDAYCRI